MLYEDAGDGFAYRDDEFRRTMWRARREGGEVNVEVAERDGRRGADARPMRVRVLGERAAPR